MKDNPDHPEYRQYGDYDWRNKSDWESTWQMWDFDKEDPTSMKIARSFWSAALLPMQIAQSKQLEVARVSLISIRNYQGHEHGLCTLLCDLR